MNQYKNFIVTICLSSLVSCGGGGGGGGSSSCGVLGAGKVTGGEQCSSGESAVVALEIGYPGGQVAICSGTLISLTTVLTAGHCLTGANGVNVYTQQRLVGSGGIGIVHPFWLANPQAGNPYDIAMLRIANPTGIGPVPILVSDDIAVGEPITIFGYGQDENANGIIERLQQGEAPLKAGDMTIGIVGGSGLFGASFDQTGSAICQGDSGGPAIQTVGGISSLVGVTSFTSNGCLDGSVSGFINLQRPDVIDFILDFTPDAAIR